MLAKFEEYCQPQKNIPFERYCFNRRIQEAGETYDQYRTALRKLAKGCELQQLLLIRYFEINVCLAFEMPRPCRERLVHESDLTLKKTDEICHTAESMIAQMKVVDDESSATVSAINSENNQGQHPTKDVNSIWECWNCGHRHEFHKRELCPAHGKTCNKCLQVTQPLCS